MAIDSIGAVPAAANTPAAAAPAAAASSLGLDDFMKILMTQLTYQDPMKPMDNQQFVAQLAQFTALQQSQQMNERLQQLLTIQSATQSVGLLGKTVEVTAADGTSSTGQVTTLRFREGQPLITVKADNGSFLADVPLAQVSLVR